jgi:PKD repeat protein
VVVSAPQGPQADFYGLPRSGAAPLNVQFFSSVSGGAATSFSWDFGDGETSVAEHPAHTYRRTGTFTVVLTVSGPNGSDTATKEEYIEVSAPPLPVVDFGASPVSGKGPLQVTFENKTSGLVDSYVWDFGDSGISDDENPVHTYAVPGTYSVRLTAYYGAQSAEKYVVDLIVVQPAGGLFIRGDSNRDGKLDISDAVGILSYLFSHKTVTCLDACDTNDSGAIDIADAVSLLSYLFASGAQPKPPFDAPGTDPTSDSLGCDL